MNCFSIVLWRKAEPKPLDFNGCTEKAFNALNTFNSLPTLYRPNYLASNSKRTSKEMKWDLDFFRSYIVQKKGEKLEIDKRLGIGYSIGLFSSFNDDQSFGYSMNICTTNTLFYNTFVIHIAPQFELDNQNNAVLIGELFKKTVKEFQPFWGCIYNSKEAGKKELFARGTPLAAHWLNYFSPDVEMKIGESKLNSIIVNYPQAIWQNGFLQLSEIPNEQSTFSLF